ncbi:hypothetical protein IHE45_06G052300 [Dioscorea alata]|uniref:Uncharacterized protein n=1 Tax=Dioscorea alata TaxID=55571 RepID=A0ACB7VXG3_DIOAL|nr:hypothetical protein IHE45_06G052300 [Dioscorea alata]
MHGLPCCNVRVDIGDDACRYLHNHISLKEVASFSQMPSHDFFIPMQEPIDSPSPMASDNSVTETSRRRKRKALARDPTMETIYKNFRQFTEMVGPVFKMMSETAARKEAARKEIEEKKKLLNQVIFEIDGLSNDEAIFILQVLVEDEDQLKTFFYVPDDKRLCFCRVLLKRMSYCPPSK